MNEKIQSLKGSLDSIMSAVRSRNYNIVSEIVKNIKERLDNLGKELEENKESEFKKILSNNYHKCLEGYNTVKKEQMKKDFHQRMDEILLIYSDTFNVSINKAKEEILSKSLIESKGGDVNG